MAKTAAAILLGRREIIPSPPVKEDGQGVGQRLRLNSLRLARLLSHFQIGAKNATE